MNFTVILQIISALPSIVKAVETILGSNEAKTIEQAVAVLINHNTPGQPNSSALAPTATPTDPQSVKLS